MYYVRRRRNLLLFWLGLRVACVLDRITRLTRFDFYSSAFNGLCGLSFKVYFRVEMQLNEAILSNKYSKLELSLLKKTKIKLFAPKYRYFELQTTQSVRNSKILITKPF